MNSPIHPFLQSYHQVSLECGSPPHLCDAMTFYKLKEFNCPSCNTPFTTAKIWNEALQALQTCLKDAMGIQLKLFAIQKKLIEEGKPIPEETIIPMKNTMDMTVKTINDGINRVHQYLDSFPFRDVPGLEFLARQAYNIENRGDYGYTVPAVGTIQVLEKFLSENNFEKKDVTIIDYGAGTALWSRFFLANGFEVLAVDCRSTRENYVRSEDSFLKNLGREIYYVEKHKCGLPTDCSKQILFLCWPENPSETSYPMYAGRVLKEFRERNGILAIYIGWERGGNTASPAFFDEMEENWAFSIVDKSKKATWSSEMYLLKKK